MMKSRNNQTRLHYQSPLVLQLLETEIEDALLAGSVVDDMNSGGTSTAGQEVEEISAGGDGSGFDHEWN